MLRRTWLGLEYWNAITGALADRADAGEISERDTWLITRRARAQSRRMKIEQVNHAAESPRHAEAWPAAAFALLSHAVVDLNGYMAAHTQVSDVTDAPVSAETEARCTSGAFALRGRRRCVMPDGS